MIRRLIEMYESGSITGYQLMMDCLQILAVTVAIVAIIVSLPIILPLALGIDYLGKRRLFAAARKCACPACGHTFGVEAVHEADKFWRAYVAEFRRSYPGVRFRLARRVDAICVRCGARLYFLKESGTFTKPEV